MTSPLTTRKQTIDAFESLCGGSQSKHALASKELALVCFCARWSENAIGLKPSAAVLFDKRSAARISLRTHRSTHASFTMADAEAPVVAEAPKEPEGPSPFEQKSPYYAKRIELFEKYFAREAEKQDAAKTTNETIKVVMPDGAIKEGVKHVTTPWDIAMGIHKKLAQASILSLIHI